MRENNDKFAQRLLSVLSVVTAVAAALAFWKYGVGIPSIILALTSIIAGLFAVARLEQMRDLFSE